MGGDVRQITCSSPSAFFPQHSYHLPLCNPCGLQACRLVEYPCSSGKKPSRRIALAQVLSKSWQVESRSLSRIRMAALLILEPLDIRTGERKTSRLSPPRSHQDFHWQSAVLVRNWRRRRLTV